MRYLLAAALAARPSVASAESRLRPPRGISADVAAARHLFEANLDAIRRHDRAGYLACYLDSPRFALTGPTGFTLGYDSLAASAGSGWPDHFEALDLELTPLAPGRVYGTYRYRVRYGAGEQTGLSERWFVETPGGWKIEVSTAFPAIAGVPAPPRAIVGGTLLDGTGRPTIRDAVVLMRDGKIEAVGRRGQVRLPAGVDTLDARGCWVLPGLVDAHGRPDALDLRSLYPYEEAERRLREHPERFHRAWLACGVTAVFDVGGYPWTLAMARAAEATTEAPHVAAAGSLLSTVDHWLNLAAERQFIYLADSATAVEGVRYLASLGVGWCERAMSCTRR